MLKVSNVKIHFKVEKSSIGYFRQIIEAYDNLAVMSTVDLDAGVVALFVSPFCKEELLKITKALSRTIPIDLIYETF